MDASPTLGKRWPFAASAIATPIMLLIAAYAGFAASSFALSPAFGPDGGLAISLARIALIAIGSAAAGFLLSLLGKGMGERWRGRSAMLLWIAGGWGAGAADRRWPCFAWPPWAAPWWPD